MVEEYNENIGITDSKSTPHGKSSGLENWIRSLQQALTVEVEHGFSNIQGRKNKFSNFISEYLLSSPLSSLDEIEFSKLKN